MQEVYFLKLWATISGLSVEISGEILGMMGRLLAEGGKEYRKRKLGCWLYRRRERERERERWTPENSQQDT